jgi:Ca-activated chloride channel homolog
MYGIEFKDPWFLAAALLVVPVVWFCVGRKRLGRFGFSSIAGLRKLSGGSLRFRTRHVVLVLRALALICLVVALARPRKGLPETEIEREGVDIVLVIDRSSSMLQEDFVREGRRVGRLEVVKDVVQDFISRRENDRIGVVVFARYAFTHAPLTLDHKWLGERVKEIEAARPRTEEDGTAIGDALGTAVNRLKYSKAESRIIVLLTDGQNNVVTWLTPVNAGKIAQDQEIKTYTIGAGAAAMRFGQPMATIDEAMLNEVARMTGGQYYRATDLKTLAQIYSTIDLLERSKIESTHYELYRELAGYPLALAGIFLLLEMVLANTVYRTIP